MPRRPQAAPAQTDPPVAPAQTDPPSAALRSTGLMSTASVPTAPGPTDLGQTDRVALLRAVNVGGLTLKMDRLRAVAAGLGWQGVRTHIASGNLLFRAPGADAALSAALEAALLAEVGARVPCLVLTAPALAARVASCPFTPTEGKLVHGLLLFGPITIDEDRLAALRASSEQLVAGPGVVWLHAPEGFGRSKLAERLEQVVRGAPFTARNLNTLRALVGLVGGGVEGGATGGGPPAT